MKMYEVEMMTKEDWGRYMGGSNYFNVQTVQMMGETADEAVMRVKMMNPMMVVNTHPTEIKTPRDWI